MSIDNQRITTYLGGIVSTKHSNEKIQMARDLRKCQTPSEKQLWFYLRANKLNGIQFRRQQVIDGFIADFYCHRAALVIELDGGIHDKTIEYDNARDALISSRGILIIRIPNTRIENEIDVVLSEIEEIVNARIRLLHPNT